MFASKAFPATAIQRVMVEEGLGLDVAGGGEILTALKAGVDPKLIVHHGNAKGDEEIALAVEHGIGLVVVDNADDVDRLEATGATQDVLVRVIPGVTADTHAHVLTGHAGSKFGLLPEDAAQLIARIERSPRLNMRGLHVHVGSQILAVEPFAESVAPLAALGEFEVYDLGGGLGARYTYADDPPSRRRLPRRADRRRAARTCRRRPRSSSSRAGAWSRPTATTLYRVVSRKRDFVAVDGGMGDNLEVALFDQRFEAAIADRLGGGERVHGRRPPLRERRRARRRRAARRPEGRRPARRPGDGRLLPHDGQQLQRQPPDPGGLRGRGRRPRRGPTRDLGRPARARRRLTRGERWLQCNPRCWEQILRRKPVTAMTAEAGTDTGEGELKRSIGLFQLSMFGIGATIGTGIFFVLDRGGARSPGRR